MLNLEQLATHAFDEHDLLLGEAVVARSGAARRGSADRLSTRWSARSPRPSSHLCEALEREDPDTREHAD